MNSRILSGWELITFNEEKLKQVEYIATLDEEELELLLQYIKNYHEISRIFIASKEIYFFESMIQIMDHALSNGMDAKLNEIAKQEKEKWKEKIEAWNIPKLREIEETIRERWPLYNFDINTTEIVERVYSRSWLRMNCTAKQEYLLRAIAFLGTRRQAHDIMPSTSLFKDEQKIDEIIKRAHISRYRMICQHNIDFTKTVSTTRSLKYFVNERPNDSKPVMSVHESVVEYENGYHFDIDSNKCLCRRF
ncbi:MAG: hypothetical protein Dasosvirus3_32 [Dasosvirus sp.]|uniref:Uncharacterized protein n=1 Tax=Dasosvirus sp. TaxID=2487764 RepID=A0A3G4ZV38_9VIRU|nr:MAG: hypothetical protein Dasosvirus3_32 [Dasosvirus sp.]